ncbi:hypothetical protein BASA81_016526 [Batrachochytrium salamandrivorans]|nr:hypothetical protein BASA81_016526 [Batrachochytrium salamandrivorans]
MMLAVATAVEGVEMEEIANIEYEEEVWSEAPKMDYLRSVRTKWKLEPVISLDRGEELLSGLISHTNLAVLFVGNTQADVDFAKEFDSIARAYWNGLERKRAVSSSNLFFFQTNASHSTKLFREYRILKAPSLVFFKMESHTKLVFDSMQQIGLNEWLSSQAEIGGITPLTMTGIGQGDSFSSETVEKIARLVLIAQVLAIAVTHRNKLWTKHVWFFISLSAYGLSVSGLIFVFLRGMPPFAFSPQHGFMFFYPEQRNQFIFEGLLAGGMHLTISTVLVSAAFFAQGVDVVETVENWLNGKQPGLLVQRRIRNGDVDSYKNVLNMAKILLMLASFLFLIVIVMFQRKASWYRPFL